MQINICMISVFYKANIYTIMGLGLFNSGLIITFLMFKLPEVFSEKELKVFLDPSLPILSYLYLTKTKALEDCAELPLRRGFIDLRKVLLCLLI